jgi:hypothetical protein
VRTTYWSDETGLPRVAAHLYRPTAADHFWAALLVVSLIAAIVAGGIVGNTPCGRHDCSTITTSRVTR